MPSARYWRLIGIETAQSGDLELTEIGLYNGASRVDGSATITCSHVPVSGSLSSLLDGSAAVACRFAAADVRSAGFYLQVDLGAAALVDGIAFSSSASEARFIGRATVLQLDGSGVWTAETQFARVKFPGANATTPLLKGASTRWNAADKGTGVTLSNNDKTSSSNRSSAVRSIFGASSGKWYFEVTSSSNYAYIGVANASCVISGLSSGLYNQANQWSLAVHNGRKQGLGIDAGYGSAAPVGTSPTVGVVLDMDAGTISFIIGGANYGVAFSGLTGTLYAIACGGDVPVVSLTINAGGAPFAYPVPAGYVAGFGNDGFAIPDLTTPAVGTVVSDALIAGSAPLSAYFAGRAASVQMARDVEVGGLGTIYGTTKTKGTPNLPTKARVVLLHQRSKLPVRETWSDPVTGAFVFGGIDTSQQFLTLAEDAEGHFRPVAANRLTPEVA